MCSGNADCGVFGGWPYLAYQYISKAVSGIVQIFYGFKFSEHCHNYEYFVIPYILLIIIC